MSEEAVPQSHPKRRATGWVILAVLVVGAGAFYWFFIPNYHGYSPLPFTPEAWAQADAEHRGYMINDLLDRHLLEGKTRKEVLDLLGKSDGTSESSIRYHVGYRGYNRHAPMVFSYQLIIRLGVTGVVSGWIIDD